MNNRQTLVSHDRLIRMLLASLFTAIIILMAFVPNLGYINLIVIKATLIHIPVIIGALLLGPKYGAFLGGIFGLTSLINNTYNPSVLSFAFSPVVAFELAGWAGILKSLFICFVPRILIGIVSYCVFSLIRGEKELTRGRRAAALAASGVIGAMTNTLLVMGSMYLLYRDAFAAARNIPVETVFAAILTIIGVNGIPEAIVSGVLVTAVCTALIHVRGVAFYEKR